MASRSLSPLALACLLFIFVQESTATFRFSDIQLIVGFSSTCTSAYQSSISNCNLNDLQGIGGSGSCSSDCKSSIRSAQSSVQRACTRETADLNSLIGKIFVGDAVSFLCDPAVETLTTTTTVAPARTSAAASTNAATTAASGTTAAGSTASSSNSQSASSSTDRSTTTTETSSSSSSSSSSSESDTSIITSSSSISTSTTTSSSPASTTTARSNGGGGNAGGGGSPFDNIGSNAAPVSKALQPHLFVLSLILTLLILL